MNITIIFLFVTLLSSPSLLARLSTYQACSLTQESVKLGGYNPSKTYMATINNQASRLGQINSDGNVHFWSFFMPDYPLLTIERDRAHGQKFTNIDWYAKTHVVIDSNLPSSNIQTKGMIVVVDNDSLQAQRFKTSTYGASKRSKYSISQSGQLLAYVPDNNVKKIIIYDLKARKEIKSLNYNFCSIAALALHPFNSTVAVKDVCGAAVRIFDLASGYLLQTINADVNINDDVESPSPSLFFWAKGNELATSADLSTTAITWHLGTGRVDLETFWMAPLPMFHNQSTTKLALVDLTLSINILKMGDPNLYLVNPFGQFVAPTALAFSPQDSYLAAAAAGGSIIIANGDGNFNNLCGGYLASEQSIQQIAFAQEQEFYTLSYTNMVDRWRVVSSIK